MGLFGEKLREPAYDVRGDEVAVLKTSRGTIRVRLDGAGAPIHVSNFCELAQSGFYDGTKFHRYVPGFVIQGGDPNTRDMLPQDVVAQKRGPKGMPGTGGPGYRIREEFTTNPRNSHEDGALAMARSQDPNSAGSQFYFCLGPQHGLDSGYTVFGSTLEGMDVIASLRVGDVLESVTIEHQEEQ